MADRDDRLDRILARQDERLAHVQHILERQERAFERQERASEGQQRAFERQERAFEFQVRTFATMTDVLERMIARLDDMGDQIRANTQAVLRMLDRLDGTEPTPGA